MDSQAQSEEQLLRRIDELEEQYRTTHEARLAAEQKLKLRHTQSHHVSDSGPLPLFALNTLTGPGHLKSKRVWNGKHSLC
jgi:hypothetical protein